MAYGRSLCTRVTLTARAYSPSFSYVLRDHDRKEDSPEKSLSQRDINNFIQQRSFGSRFNSSYGSGAFFNGNGVSQFSLGSSAGSAFVRYMSTTGGEGPDKIEMMSDVADGLSDAITQVVTNHAPAVNEVSIAAADSFLTVAALQHFIGAIQNFTGLNWWGSIVVTALFTQSAQFPLFIYQVKDFSKQKQKLCKECDVSALSKWWSFINVSAYYSGLLAILNMAEKVPSFKSGGAFWFTDLTTPDSFYVLPILIGLSCLLLCECHAQNARKKRIGRVLAVLFVPLTMTLPKAASCFVIASNLFSFMFGLVVQVPRFKKALGVSEIPVAPPTTTPQPSLFFSAIKQLLEAINKKW